MARIQITVFTTTHGRVNVEQAFNEVVGKSNVAEAVAAAGAVIVAAHSDEATR